MDLASHFDPTASPDEVSRSVSWVIRQMLGQFDERKNLTIVDLSGLPFDVVDTTVAVITRALFDFNFWSPPDVRHPVLLVFEEAHNYLPHRPVEGRRMFARNAVEKVAKEGRKYGVAAMIVSQRPSEISETVLSQCNTMVLMRMNNPDDQEYAARVVSDQFRSLISLLPSMKPGEGFIIGDSVLMPMRTLIDMPPREPQSANVDFFGLWSSGGKGCDVDRIVDRWWRQERSAGSFGRDTPPATSKEPVADTPAPAPPPALKPHKLNAPRSSNPTMPPPPPKPAEPAPEPSPPEQKPTASATPQNQENTTHGSGADQKLAQLAAMLGDGKLKN